MSYQVQVGGAFTSFIALAVPSSCSLIRIMRSSLLAELSSDYVRFAKARGLSANRILVCHILRNALPPVVTIFFQQFGFLIAGGAVIESVFQSRESELIWWTVWLQQIRLQFLPV